VVRPWLPTPSRPQISVSLGVGGCLLCGGGAFLASPAADFFSPLVLGLAAAALVGNIAAAEWDERFSVGGSFTASMLAVAFVGPGPAVAIAAFAELCAWLVQRYRLPALPINILASAGANLVAGELFLLIGSTDATRSSFFGALAAVAVVALLINALTVTTLISGLYGGAFAPRVRAFAGLVPAMGIAVLMTIGTAAIYASAGFGGAVLVLAGIFAYTHMARLVVTARERTRQYAALSWGVLSGLIRTLDLRDSRAARHAAAVAAFSRDIAQTVGMSARECELAHTAGLLHDIGRFGLSDRVMERGRTLTEQDWIMIRRHPEMGEDLLRDLGVYGPVAEIVRAHHERLDGRGYPDGLADDEIPEIAKIVAVAEVYDTLTAVDTYRTPVSSFEALTELRRVAGTQVEARYVEALAELLAGRGVDYRHADAADFDSELDVERRIGEAVGAEPAAVDQAAGQ
jgi:putative nucleotidyltransferase with HDIG domain